LETFIKIVFWAIVIYYVLKLAMRFLLPFILKRLAKKVLTNFENMQGQAYNDAKKKKEGDVTIEYKDSKKKGNDLKNTGEYVDFEEIKD